MNENPSRDDGVPGSVGEWCELLGEWAASKGWGVNKRSALERVALIHTELSEAVTALRDGRSTDEILIDESGAPRGFPIELADAVMRIMVLCAEDGINLEEAMLMKHHYNQTRARRHGGRIF